MLEHIFYLRETPGAVAVSVDLWEDFIDKPLDFTLITARSQRFKIGSVEFGLFFSWRSIVPEVHVAWVFRLLFVFDGVLQELLLCDAAIPICIHFVECVHWVGLNLLVCWSHLTQLDAVVVSHLLEHVAQLVEAPSTTAICIYWGKNFVYQVFYFPITIAACECLKIRGVEGGSFVERISLLLVRKGKIQKFIFSNSAISISVHSVEDWTCHLCYLLIRGSCLAHCNTIVVADLTHHFLHLVKAPSTISVLINRSKNFINKLSDLSVICTARKVFEICWVERTWHRRIYWPTTSHHELACVFSVC